MQISESILTTTIINTTSKYHYTLCNITPPVLYVNCNLKTTLLYETDMTTNKLQYNINT